LTDKSVSKPSSRPDHGRWGQVDPANVEVEVSIVIPLYNDRHSIAQCLEACFSQDYQAEMEVIVVDDGSTDDSAVIARRFPITYLFQKNAGPAAARNLGWRNARGKIIYFLDADCIPQPNCISLLLEGFTNAAVGGVGGTMVSDDTTNLLVTIVQSEISLRHAGMQGRVDFLGSFNTAYRRDVLERTHGFNTALITAEDIDLAFRVTALGYELRFTNQAAVNHHSAIRLLGYLRTQLKHGYYRILMYRNHLNKLSGDSYSNLVDHFQPPVVACLMAACMVNVFHPALWPLDVALGVIFLALQAPMVSQLFMKTGPKIALLFLPLSFTRGIARGIGGFIGVMSSVIRRLRPSP
jgi:glycosyltransferase involved in cell wall biosynthesis